METQRTVVLASTAWAARSKVLNQQENLKEDGSLMYRCARQEVPCIVFAHQRTRLWQPNSISPISTKSESSAHRIENHVRRDNSEVSGTRRVRVNLPFVSNRGAVSSDFCTLQPGIFPCLLVAINRFLSLPSLSNT
jgi:hypothetical protein